MKSLWKPLLAVTLALQFGSAGVIQAQNAEAEDRSAQKEAADLMAAQPRLLRITATVDGSGRLIFTRAGVKYERKNWKTLANVVFGGELWTDLSRTPAIWKEMAPNVDLSKAWIVKRQGRDVVALEHTPDGFDLYLSDSPNGEASYEVLIAIPRRP